MSANASFFTCRRCGYIVDYDCNCSTLFDPYLRSWRGNPEDWDGFETLEEAKAAARPSPVPERQK